MALFNYECDEVKHKIDEVSPNYPQLTTYEKEWLYFHKYGYIPGVPVELEHETVNVNPTGMVQNAIPYQYKSAILKGQTLVNLVKNPSDKKIVGKSNETNARYEYLYQLDTTKPYTLQFVVSDFNGSTSFRCSINNGNQHIYDFEINGNGTYKVLTQSASGTSTELWFYWDNGSWSDENTAIVSNIVFIEDDYTNVDIPYFEGMQSVQMPVLTTFGKNLFNIKNKGASRSGWYSIPLEMPFNGEVYVKCADSLPSDFRICLLDIHKNEHVLTNEQIKNGHTAYYQNLTAIEFHCQSLSIEEDSRGILDDLVANGDIVIDVGGEPYKSNILSTSEDVVLRGIGDVKDELDLQTGKLTQRIGESNSENFTNCQYTMELFNGYCAAIITLNNKNTDLSPEMKTNIKTNLVPTQTFTDGLDCGIYNNPLNVVIFKKGATLEEFKKLVSNLIIQYQLETPTVKTVALTPLKKPYEGTNHYELIANIPCEAILEVPVVSTGKQTLLEINN